MGIFHTYCVSHPVNSFCLRDIMASVYFTSYFLVWPSIGRQKLLESVPRTERKERRELESTDI